jgi:hypothetical protein
MSQLQDAVTLAAELAPGAELEQTITDACTELSMAPTTELQELIFARIRVLHGRRTAEMVERLEKHRGLR